MKYIILGLNAMGRSLGAMLTQTGNEVMGVDKDAQLVDAAKHEMTGTICLDATDSDALSSLPLSECDAVIVAFGKDFGVSVKTTALLKNLKVDRVIVRSISDIQEAVVKAIGITEILYPENEFASAYTSRVMLGGSLKERFNVTDTADLYKIVPPQITIGQTLKSIGFEENFDLRLVGIERLVEKKNVLGLKQHRYELIKLADDLAIEADDVLIVFGEVNNVSKFVKV